MAGQHFRAGAVMVVRRPADGHVLVFERADVPGAWQFPQGGLDAGESPVEAAWRELAEEAGLATPHVELVGESADWVAYELPEAFRTTKMGRGQVQRWFLFDLIDSGVGPTVDGSEFVAYRWMSPDQVVREVVPFRRRPYESGLRQLGVLAGG